MQRPRRLGLAAASLLVAAGLTACGSSGSTTDQTAGASSTSTSSDSTSMSMSSTAPAGTAKDTVVVKNFSFAPATLTVSAGTTVTWDFEDSAAHTVQIAALKVTSKPLMSGGKFSYKFTKAGTYSYICSIHQYMQGTVVVTKS